MSVLYRTMEADMSTFDRSILEVPQHSVWHLVSGTIVLSGGFFGALWGVAWLIS